jgi:hypothetical protein
MKRDYTKAVVWATLLIVTALIWGTIYKLLT